MQTIKEDIKQTIVDCAREEFLKHGYEDSSMRIIAKKANTSLGNIYHYFPNKRAILDYLVQPTVCQVCDFIEAHSKLEQPYFNMQQIDEILEEVDFEAPQMKALLSKEFVIFMETKEWDYVQKRDETITIFRSHIAKHMRFGDAQNHFVVIVTKMMIDCVIHMIRCNECVKDKKQDMVEMFKLLCRSVAMNDCLQLQNPNDIKNEPK